MAKTESDIDWSVLKLSLIMFAIIVVISGSMLTASHYFNANMEKEYNQNKNQFQSISRRYLDIDQEEQLLLDYYPKFVKLYNEGLIGREKRLNWIEALRKSGEKVDIPKLSYAIESQAEFIPGFSVDYSGYKLYTSRMELMLGLLHEGDIFDLLNELNSNAKGMYSVNECSFRKSGSGIEFRKDYINIDTVCTLQWITINLPDSDLEIL